MPSPSEIFWLEKTRAALGVPAGTDTETLLEKARTDVRALSDLFTTERPRDGKFRDYMSEPRLLAAPARARKRWSRMG